MSYYQAKKKKKQKIENRFGRYKKLAQFWQECIGLSVDDTGRPMGQAMVYMEEVRAGDTNLSH